ncbi:MAG: 6-carboxytetrahydropterin synthase [Pseudomonadales bacterium]|jgi:6-pyruvoyltetrahydropterin/6-carboxytetrahydropterin synthase
MSHRLTTINICKEALKFSGAHFTIFSGTDRERLHGHNFRVRAEVTAPVDDNGMCFNYQEIKTRLRTICHALDEYMLLPGKSPHLKIEHIDKQYHVHFNDEVMVFIADDTRILDIRNTTVEEFSYYILDQMVSADTFFIENDVANITIGVSSGDGQWGSSTWVAS